MDIRGFTSSFGLVLYSNSKDSIEHFNPYSYFRFCFIVSYCFMLPLLLGTLLYVFRTEETGTSENILQIHILFSKIKIKKRLYTVEMVWVFFSLWI